MGRAQDAIAEYQEGLRDKDDRIDELMRTVETLEQEKHSLSIRCMDLQEENESLIDELNSLRNKTSIENDLPQKNNTQLDVEIRTSSRSKENMN